MTRILPYLEDDPEQQLARRTLSESSAMAFLSSRDAMEGREPPLRK
jgi:hypothetical protein